MESSAILAAYDVVASVDWATRALVDERVRGIYKPVDNLIHWLVTRDFLKSRAAGENRSWVRAYAVAKPRAELEALLARRLPDGRIIAEPVARKADVPKPAARSTPKAQEPQVQEVIRSPALRATIVSAALQQLDVAIGDLAAELAERFVVQFERKICESVARLADGLQTDGTLPDRMARLHVGEWDSPPPKARLKKVLVVGLLPQQAGMISAEFGECFDLRFWKDESHQQLKKSAAAAEYCVAFTSKCAHAATEMIKSVGKDLLVVQGGLTELRAHLTDLYLQEGV